MAAGSPSQRRSWRVGLGVVVALGALLLWREYGHAPIQDWRQTDTQAIARHMAEPGARLLYPRIDWGGAGPGYVETEFQLYTWFVGKLLRVFGDVEWPGRLLSLLATLGAAAVVFRGLARRHGDAAAAIGTLVLLGARAVAYVALSVQPEALCLLLYASAWFSWLDFESTQSRRALVAYAVCGALAMLVKPTAGQLGIASFLLLLLRSRALLGRPAVWLAWFAMLGVFALHLWHARNLYLEYGNTFGVLSGGDSKIPHLQQLLRKRFYFLALTHLVVWGFGVVGAFAVAAALLLRRGTPLLLALLVANGFWTVLTLRYSSDNSGNHYHVLAAVTAAHGAAFVADHVLETGRRAALVALVAVALAGFGGSVALQLRSRVDPWNAPTVSAGAALARVARPGELVAVRSVQSDYDPVWQTPNNFQDPRVFYASHTHGWALSLDDLDPTTLARAAVAGARFYVETLPRAPSPPLDAWLAAHASLVASTNEGGQVYALAKSDSR